jgi:hypothetical protein
MIDHKNLGLFSERKRKRETSAGVIGQDGRVVSMSPYRTLYPCPLRLY